MKNHSKAFRERPGCWRVLQCLASLFHQDWWNSTSFANYYRTWNIVVHDWLYYYGYRDFLWVRTDTPESHFWNACRVLITLTMNLCWTPQLSGSKLRSVATLSVFAVSALVHEYAFTMGFGFFYPVMFCTFAGIGGKNARKPVSEHTKLNYENCNHLSQCISKLLQTVMQSLIYRAGLKCLHIFLYLSSGV